MNTISLRIRKDVARKIRKGHPWLFDGAILHQNKAGSAGDVAVLYDENRDFVAVGLYDPHSQIRVRVLERNKPMQIDDAFLDQRIKDACKIRLDHFDADTTGYRVVHGENDGMGGLVVDRYGEMGVIKVYSSAWLPRIEDIQKHLQEHLGVGDWVIRHSRDVQKLADEPDQESRKVVFKENGLLFEIDPVRGQKTGFFLDQRDNRARVEKLAKGKRVLNVFSYSGGFSLYAARGGASSVVSLDQDRHALKAAKRNFELNALSVSHETICKDAFLGMKELIDAGEKFDLIVLDPPSFAKNQREIEGALKSYQRLHRLGMNLASKSATLVLASCSSRVSMEDFRNAALRAADRAERRIEIFDETEHGVDHPVTFLESAYLKCLYAKCL